MLRDKLDLARRKFIISQNLDTRMLRMSMSFGHYATACNQPSTHQSMRIEQTKAELGKSLSALMASYRTTEEISSQLRATLSTYQDDTRADKLIRWIMNVGRRVSSRGERMNYAPYLDTIRIAAIQSTTDYAPQSNLVLGISYASLLPISAHPQMRDRNSPAPLQDYMSNVKRVWDSAVHYSDADHQMILGGHFSSNLRRATEWGFIGASDKYGDVDLREYIGALIGPNRS